MPRWKKGYIRLCPASDTKRTDGSSTYTMATRVCTRYTIDSDRSNPGVSTVNVNPSSRLSGTCRRRPKGKLATRDYPSTSHHPPTPPPLPRLDLGMHLYFWVNQDGPHTQP
ncbi:predicted protein [Plenodomus lingam JN3]|uniref:Predicted protein n=1 Tax=Leptosphaeria maculans (strain JN3 / isolate v23.1.3 / race Av1-4-5-6-7-8) TaxID=985895 RepID=E4ZTV2_LEPMJ|nr:predicted protein [Plenodomus lingam JN3]CBX94662.1 predicted protein [Plenodomus lingam JN3]